MAASSALRREVPTPVQLSDVPRAVEDRTYRTASDVVIPNSSGNKAVTRHRETGTGNSERC